MCRSVRLCVFFHICCSLLVFWKFSDCDLCVGMSFFATCVFWLQVFMYVCVSRFVALWFVIWSSYDLYVNVLLIDLFRF
jgi:hypothetical protein